MRRSQATLRGKGAAQSQTLVWLWCLTCLLVALTAKLPARAGIPPTKIPAQLEPLLSETWIPTEDYQPTREINGEENYDDLLIYDHASETNDLFTPQHLSPTL